MHEEVATTNRPNSRISGILSLAVLATLRLATRLGFGALAVTSVAVPLFAQPAGAPAEQWSCGEAFSDLVSKLEENYIGLRQRQLSGTLDGYEEHKSDFHLRALDADATTCTKTLGEFLRFQGDGHVFVYERPEYGRDELEQFRKRARENSPSQLELDKLASESSELSPIVGRWTDGRSEIAIVAVGDGYRAYLRDSDVEGALAGDLKAELSATADVSDDTFEGTYYSYDFAPRAVTAQLSKESTLLNFGSGILWGKLESAYQREVAMIDTADPSRPTLQKLDSESTLISIPSFLVDYSEFQTFLSQHREVLASTKNLVIDIRGNSGGNAIYFPLIGNFSNRRMAGSQGLVLASPANLDYFRRAGGSRIYKRVAKEIESRMGEIVDGPAYPSRKQKSAKTQIERVAILTDGGCMSAAESFVLHSKRHSDRVTTFGAPTAGVIDYTSVNTLRLASGNRNIFFGYPTSTLHKRVPEEGYNRTGIEPDTPIGPEVRDKVAFVLDSMRGATE